MSVPSSEYALPLVFLAGLAGSAHCLAMCGGLAVAAVHSKKQALLYQLGRLTGYLCLGATAGAAGSVALWKGQVGTWQEIVSTIAAVSLATIFFIQARNRWYNLPSHQQFGFRFFSKATGKVFGATPAPVASLFAGLLTAFLPCGWLHAFVAASATTGSPVRGMLVMGVFWLGSAPALAVGPVIAQRYSQTHRRLGAGIFLTAGILMIVLKVAQLFGHRLGGAHLVCGLL